MTDLHTPEGLEQAERATAAAARAIAHEPSLRFRAHLLYQDDRPASARAPHLYAPSEAQELQDLRGASDGVALRVLHSDDAVYALHRPDGGFEELIYEMLEQLRVEALAPDSAPGLRANLHHRFMSWSDAYVGEGLLENDLGLLFFAVIHVCRSRIQAVPIEERVNDHTEATRFGIYDILGEHLRDLRTFVADQEAFAPHAAAIAISVGDLAAAAEQSSRGGRSASPLLAILEFNAFQREETEATNSGSQSRRQQGQGYAVFSGTYDRIMSVDEVVLPHAQRTARVELEALLSEHRPLGAYLTRTAHALFPAPQDFAWSTDEEQGHVDPRRLSAVVTGHDGRIFQLQAPLDRPDGVVGLLIDCSGSMKAVMPQVAVLVDYLVKALDSVDICTEVMGFTTGAWSGGRPYREWLSAGRPPHPGRLNETCHIVFKDADMSWRRSRGALAGLLWTPMFREGIDGEALEWAYRRMRQLDAAQRHLIVVSDGSPMDGATALTNDEGYLDRHLITVVSEIESQGDVRLYGLGIGHDMSTYMTHSRIVDPDHILDVGTARSLMKFLGHS